VTEVLEFVDLSPCSHPLTSEDESWLARVQDEVDLSPHVVRLGDAQEGMEPIVSCDPFGRWRAGRYIGHLSLGDRRLVIKPRLGLAVIERLLDGAFNLITPPESAARRESEAFIARLLARVWCRAVDAASRHGPPGLRIGVRHESSFVRGRLDLRQTMRLRRTGSPRIVSTAYEKSLDHAISRTLVCAERALNSQLGGTGEWRTDRVRDVMPHLQAAVGSRPRLPNRREISRIRYTPITRPYQRAVEISHRIAERRGFLAAAEPGRSEGLLIDVAELWELFVLHCVRRAFPGFDVEHGAKSRTTAHLLKSMSGPTRGLGVLLPDVLVRSGSTVIAVIDAKYKRLTFSRERPNGVARDDLYQLAAYLGRFGGDGRAVGVLAYPDDESAPAYAAVHGPWRNESGNPVHFLRLAVDADGCTATLRSLLTPTGDVRG